MKVAPFIFAAVVAASPATAADQFDLFCRGKIESFSLSGSKVEPFEYHYRLDLVQAKYCQGNCRALFDIAKVQPGSLTMSEKRTDTPSEDSFSTIVINRETGELVGSAGSRFPGRPELTVTLKWLGTCEPGPFSGFTEPKTKF